MKRFTLRLLLCCSLISPLTYSKSEVRANSPQAPDGARRITPIDLREQVKKGQAILVDVRSVEAYKAGHIKGARSIPATEIASRAGELPRDKLIATYCS